MNILEDSQTNIKDLTQIMASLSIASPEDENKAKVPAIKQLVELESISDEALIQTFWENRETIYSNPIHDIERTLMKRNDFDVLKRMRAQLCDLAGKTFSQYNRKIPIN